MYIIERIACAASALICLSMAAEAWVGISGGPAPLLYEFPSSWGGQGYPLFTSPWQAIAALILGFIGGHGQSVECV